MTIISRNKLILMKNNDFNNIFHKKINLSLIKKIEINGTEGKSFTGFIVGIEPADIDPNLPTHLKFILENKYVYFDNRKRSSLSLVKNIRISNVDELEIL